MQNLLSRIRDASREVAEAARWVRIDDAALLTYPEVVELSAQGRPSHDPDFHVLADQDRVIAFFIILDTVNFGSGYFPYLDKARGPSGYFTIAGRLKDRFERDGPLTSTELRALDAGACADLFGQSMENPHAAELMWLFATALN
ncbi:MAG: hypothetical protein ACK4S3_07410, partial [Parvibaculum sp.]